MYFTEPRAFLLLIFIPIFVGLLALYFRSDRVFFRRLLNPAVSIRPYLTLCLLSAVLIGSMAGYLSDPRSKTKEHASALSGTGDYIILVDVSYSMAARPSPSGDEVIEKARKLMHLLVNRFPNARFRIVGYAKITLPLSSLSKDSAYLHETIDHSVVPKALYSNDSDIANAIATVARDVSENPEYASIKNVIVFSDGQISNSQLSDFTHALNLARKAEIRVATVGIGSTEGYRIPKFDKDGKFTGKYEYTGRGRVFVSYLKPEILQQIAEQTEGAYFSQTEIGALTEYIAITLSPNSNNTPNIIEKTETQGNSMGWIFLLVFTATLTLFLFFFRRVY